MWACANFRTTPFCRWATRQWRSHQNTHKTFPAVQIVFFTFSIKWFLCFYFWAVIWSYIVDLFAALRELASANARTLLKLASSVCALLKPYEDTASNPKYYFRKNANLKLFQKRLDIFSQHLKFFWATVQPQIWYSLSHDRAGEGLGSILDLTSQTVLHACS